MGKRFDRAAHIEESKAQLQEAEAWRLRVESALSVERIAVELGVSRATAVRRLASARARVVAESSAYVIEHREEQLAQLDRTIERTEVLIKACVRQVEDQDTGEVTTVIDHPSIARHEANRLGALDRRAKLLGLNAVEKVEVSATVTHVEARDLELAALIEAQTTQDA